LCQTQLQAEFTVIGQTRISPHHICFRNQCSSLLFINPLMTMAFDHYPYFVRFCHYYIYPLLSTLHCCNNFIAIRVIFPYRNPYFYYFKHLIIAIRRCFITLRCFTSILDFFNKNCIISITLRFRALL
jgi:hypothetical protein